jgi:hypothetical protein
MTKSGKKHTFKRTDVIDNIIKMRLEGGLSRTSILNFLIKQLGYSQPYSYQLIRDASAEFESRAIANFGDDLKEDIERFEMLYEKAMRENNIREASKQLVEISKLKGHYIQRVELSGEIQFKAKFDE